MAEVYIRESQSYFGDPYIVTWHDGPMPAYQSKTYPTLDAAKATVPASTQWQQPDEDADGDILFVAYLPHR